ncbi:MAG: SCO family protein [Verrucomicrobiota bacterium]|nr:SCO family protein [Verrucomicrobiota bacterium]
MSTAAVVRKPRPSLASILWYASLILLPLVTAAFLFWLRQTQVAHMASRTISDYGTVPQFQLTNQEGQPFGSPQLAGKIWIADFIFTSCPGPCPMISSRMSELQRPLESSDVHLVTFTVDPETDTPAVLRDYAQRLHAQPGRWDFLTGDKDAIYSLSQNGFKLAAVEGAAEDGGPVHSTRAVLVDRRGTIRGYYDITAPDGVTKLLADTSHLLREQPKQTGR